MGNNKYKRQYYAKKFKKTKSGLINSKKAELNTLSSFQEIKNDEDYIEKKLNEVTNMHLADKLDNLSLDLSKYIKYSKKWLLLRVIGGVSIAIISLGLFIYGKIKLETLIDLLKMIGSGLGLV